MRRAALLFLPALLLVGCGGGSESATATPSSAPTTTAERTASYAEQFIAEYNDTFGQQSNSTGGTGTTADWEAFVTTLEGLDPPSGSEGEHNRAVSAFQAYADARAELDETCETAPTSGDCYGAAFDTSQAWQAALDSSYELPGISGPG